MCVCERECVSVSQYHTQTGAKGAKHSQERQHTKDANFTPSLRVNLHLQEVHQPMQGSAAMDRYSCSYLIFMESLTGNPALSC